MSRAISIGFLISCLIVCCVSALDCNCDDEIEIIQTTKVYQTVSDYLIGLAYFSIPLELLYFVSRSNIPFKWVRIQFVTFIVLCGLTHLLNAMAYHEQFRHSFLLVVSLTLAKLFKALVSCATAITLLTLIPLLLKWKLSEFFLKQNVLELDQEVGMMKKQKECSVYGLVMDVKQVEKGSGLSYMVKVSKGRQGNPEKSNVKKWVLILVGVVDGLIILLVFGGLAYYLIQKRRRNLLLAATNNTTCQIVELGV